MAIQGFDYNYFMSGLLNYVKTNFTGWETKTTADVEKVIANLYPAAADKAAAAQDFYTAYGDTWGLSPNALFNVTEYKLAAALQKTAWAQAQFDAGKFFSLEQAKAAFDTQIAENPYTHYLQVGAALGVNPSNAFDESTFLQNLVTYFKLDMTATDLRTLAIANNITPLAFYVDSVVPVAELAKDITAPPVPTGEQVTPPATITYTVSAAATSVDEGKSITYTVKADSAVAADTVISFAVSASSTAGPDDFDGATSGTVTIAKDATEATFTVAAKADNAAEFSESFTVNVTQDGKAVGSATTTINNVTVDIVAPTITAAQTFNYAENQTTAGTSLGKVVAADDTAVTAFTIATVNGVAPEAGKELFAIDASGNVSLTDAGKAAATASNDYETAPNAFKLGIVASDAAGNKSTATDVTFNVTNVDDDPPVLSTATGSTNKIVLAYNEALDTASIPSKGDFYVTQTAGNTTTVVDVSTVSMTSSSIELILGTAVTSGATVKVSYTPGTKPIQDTMGFDAAALSNQAVTTDTTAPTKATLSPADDATGVAVGSDLILTMSETVLAGTGSIVLYKSDGTVVETFNVATGVGTAGGKVAFSGTAVTINPFADLAASTNYYVKVDATAVKDSIGNLYAGITNTTEWNFSTPGASGTTGKTVALTQTADTVSTTATNASFQTSDGDDTINGLLDSGAATFASTLDNINGGNGTDTLNAYGQSGANNLTTVTGIEKYTFRTGSNPASFNMATTSGYTYLTNEGSSAALDFLNIGNTSTILQVQGATGDTGFIHGSTVLQGTSDSVNISVNGYAPGTTTNNNTTNTKGIILLSGIETLNFTSTTNASQFGIFTDDNGDGTALGGEGSIDNDGAGGNQPETLGYASATSLVFTGNANIAIVNPFTAVKTVNGSSFDAGFTVDLTGNAEVLSVTGGKGNDTVTVTENNLVATAGSTKDTINLGDGTGDRVILTDAASGTTASIVNGVVSNTEILRFGTTNAGTAGADALTASSYTGIHKFEFGTVAGNAAAATFTLGGIETADTLIFRSSPTAVPAVPVAAATAGRDVIVLTGGSAGQNANLVFGFSGGGDVAATAGNGSVGATVGNGGAAAGVGGNAIQSDASIAKVLIDVSYTNLTLTGGAGGAADANGGGAAAAGGAAISTVSSLEVTGSRNLTIAGGAHGDGNTGAAAAFDTAISINAATFTGNLTTTLSGSGTGDIFTGGFGADDISGLAGADKLLGNGGNDTLVGGADNDTLAGGDGNDRLDGGAGVDVLAGGAGNDTYRFDHATALTGAAPAASNADRVVTTEGSTGWVDGEDFIAISAGNTFDGPAGLAAGAGAADSSVAIAAGSTVVQTVAQNAGATAVTAGADLIKLTTAVASAGTDQLTFNAAIGSATLTGFTTATLHLASFYDTTLSQAVFVEANIGGAGDTTLGSGDAIRIIGRVDMTATDYANFTTADILFY